MAGPFDFLHIKGRTAGSSNELSFDVLDARRSTPEAQGSRVSRIPSAPRPSQGTYHGVAGTSTLSAVPEVERRKRHRRNRAVAKVIAALVAAAALATLVGIAGYRFYEEKLDFTTRFTTLIDRFVEADRDLVKIDALMTDPLNAPERSNRAEALKSFPGIEQMLASITADVDALVEQQGQDQDLAALHAVSDATAARLEMLAVAESAFKLSDIANRHASDAITAWNTILSADTTAREATQIANAAATEKTILDGRSKTVEALGRMREGRDQLVVVEHGVTGLDLSSELAYVDMRIESLEYAIETADALVAGNASSAISANDAYNAADRAAADQAAHLPASIAAQVKSRYADGIEDLMRDYVAARAAASAADAIIRAA